MDDENEMAEAGLGATALTAEERNELLRCYHLPEFVPSSSEDDDDDDVVPVGAESAEEDPDQATVVPDTDANLDGRCDVNVAENVDTEIERASNFLCKCTLYEDGPCCRQFSPQQIAAGRMGFLEMSEGRLKVDYLW